MTNAYKPYAYMCTWLYEMSNPKKRARIETTLRTTIVIDKQLWKHFLSYVVNKHGGARKVSTEVEEAIREYLEKHKID